jgi:hypothetical protein
MKPTILLGLAALAFSLPAPARAQNTTAPKERAIIVIRHGEDLDSDKTGWIQRNKTYAKGGQLTAADRDWVDNYVPTWPNYTLPANTKRVSNNIVGARAEEPISSLTVYQHGLSAEGGEQAKYLASVLDTLTAYLNVAPISRVITKDPSESTATPNPFDTIFPYLKTFKGELLLVRPGIDPLTNPIIDKGLAVMLPNFKKNKLDGTPPLLDPQTSGSTLIVWDAEGIWGPKVKSDRPMNSKSLLTKFGTPGVSDNIKTSSYVNGGGCPAKAARLYVFLPRPTPAGNDCIVVDLVKDASGKRTTKVVAEIAVKDNDVLKSLPDRAVSETETSKD